MPLFYQRANAASTHPPNPAPKGPEAVFSLMQCVASAFPHRSLGQAVCLVYCSTFKTPLFLKGLYTCDLRCL